MTDEKVWYVRLEDGKAYGPADVASLVSWAEDGRIGPTTYVSTDRRSWQSAPLMSELGMKWLVEVSPGDVFGPFNRAVVSNLFKKGALHESTRVYRLHEFPIDEDPPPVEKIVEKIVEKEVIKEVPVEVIKEVRVEVPAPPPEPVQAEYLEPEVVEAVALKPPQKTTDEPFGGRRNSLAALEAALQRELAAASRQKKKFGFFGR